MYGAMCQKKWLGRVKDVTNFNKSCLHVSHDMTKVKTFLLCVYSVVS